MGYSEYLKICRLMSTRSKDSRGRAAINAAMARHEQRPQTLQGAFLRSLPRIVIATIATICCNLYFASDKYREARQRGAILFEKGDALGAHDAYVDALFNIPADLEEAKAKQAKAQLESQIGVCLVSLGRRADAAKRFENALEIDPDHTQARRLLSVQQRMLAQAELGATSSRKEGQHDAARAMLQHAIDVNPSDPSAYAALARAWHRGGAVSEALAALDHSINLTPDVSETFAAQHNAGVLLLALGRTREASARLEAAVAIRPMHLPSHTMLAVTRPREELSQLDHPLRAALSVHDVPEEEEEDEDYYAVVARSLLSSPLPPPAAAAAESTPVVFDPAIFSSSSSSSTTHLADALTAALRSGRGYAIHDHLLGGTVLSQLRRAETELASAMSRGTTGLPGTAGSSGGHARNDAVVRLPSADREWSKQLSLPLRSGLHSLRTLLLQEVHVALLGLRGADLPPLWPREELQVRSQAATRTHSQSSHSHSPLSLTPLSALACGCCSSLVMIRVAVTQPTQTRM